MTAGVIPVLHPSGAVRAAIRRGVPGGTVRVIACRSLERVEALLARQLVEAIVIDVRASWAERSFTLARAFPRIPVFGLSEFRPDDGALLAACRRAALMILVESVDEPALGEMIAPRCASRMRRLALADAPRLLRLTEPLQLQVWERVLDWAGRPTRTTELAVALSRSREHVSREFAAGGAPNLKRVIDLARAAWASDLLGNPGYSVQAVARILGYSSASHLAGSAWRIAGVAPRALGRLGPRGVLQRFVRGRTRSRLG